MSKEREYKKKISKHLNDTIESGFIPELGEHKSGKVRDIYFTSKKIGEPIVMVASDRVSAFDYILNQRIPFKGRVLNQLNEWAFANTKDIVPNALEESPHSNVVVQKFYKNIMIECVVRGFVWGSLAGEYESGQRDFYGTKLGEGHLRYEKFKEPFFTPTTKADDHDAPMTYKEVEKKLGKKLAKKVKDISIKLYKRGEELALKQGLIFIDTKYEFGLDSKGKLFLIDEANTPDSSRYCSVDEYAKFDAIKKHMSTGKYKDVSELLRKKPSFKIKELSKQFVRDVLTKKGFSYGGGESIPDLSPKDVVEVSYRYIRLYEKLTGEEFKFPEGGAKASMLEKLKSEKVIKGGLVVIMAGSDSDMAHIKKIQKELDSFGVPSEIRICSAHKQPGLCEQIVKKYNSSLEPIVIIGIAGGTDALSGVASFHSVHPVVSCPPDADDFWSCLNNPPGSSNATVLKPKNAARFAAQILGYHIAGVRETMKKNDQKKIDGLLAADRSA